MKSIIKLLPLPIIWLTCDYSIAQNGGSSGTMQYALVQSFETQSTMPDVNPFGFDIGVSFQGKSSSPIYIGLGFGYQNYGGNRSHGDIKTTHNIYNLGIHLRGNLHQSRNFACYIKGDLGMNFLNTRSFVGSNGIGTFGKNFLVALVAGDDDDTEYYEVNVLHSFTTTAPNLGIGFGIELPLDLDNDFMFFEVGYRHLGKTELIEKQNVHIGYDHIEYLITESNLSLVNIKFGVTHYF